MPIASTNRYVANGGQSRSKGIAAKPPPARTAAAAPVRRRTPPQASAAASGFSVPGWVPICPMVSALYCRTDAG